MIRQVDISELALCERIYADARDFMRECGNGDQWGVSYPPRERIREDILLGKLYGIYYGDALIGVFYFAVETDPSYAKIYDGEWPSDGEYGVIHRVAISSASRGRGAVGECFNFCKSRISRLRIDTHKDNIPMQSALEKHGFTFCGKLIIARSGERIAYQWDR